MAAISVVINRALEKANIKDPSQDAASEDVSTAIDELNDMMLEWSQDGMFVNYSVVSASTDDNTAWEWVHGAMKSFLALRLCSEYQKPIPVGLSAVATKQWERLRRHTVEFPTMGNSETMPVGSGNQYGGHWDDGYFYDQRGDELTVPAGTATDGRGVPVHDGPVADDDSFVQG